MLSSQSAWGSLAISSCGDATASGPKMGLNKLHDDPPSLEPVACWDLLQMAPNVEPRSRVMEQCRVRVVMLDAQRPPPPWAIMAQGVCDSSTGSGSGGTIWNLRC
ncbi:hypothetical protein B296_00005569 [Ensete ventricosum]|uniref:Uncharacterized protein n=1 Tax=Ensete ventricosum TaxID=4639 RepID=A0A427AES0_ENSVE|nr:hypothetical protein B296_00005569 [Ensete ventricosum]